MAGSVAEGLGEISDGKVVVSTVSGGVTGDGAVVTGLLQALNNATVKIANSMNNVLVFMNLLTYQSLLAHQRLYPQHNVVDTYSYENNGHNYADDSLDARNSIKPGRYPGDAKGEKGADD